MNSIVPVIIFRGVCGLFIGPACLMIFGFRWFLNRLAHENPVAPAMVVAAIVGFFLLALTTKGLPWRSRD